LVGSFAESSYSVWFVQRVRDVLDKQTGDDMGRPKRRLDSDAGPVQRFAHELRGLRDSAGRPSYRELARRAHYSVTALSDAAGGERLPSKAVTLAYVQACGGDVAAWETRWHQVTAELGETAGADDGGRSPYLGLTAFEPHDAALFFGRAEIVGELCARLADSPFVAVFGASGSGKSSILRAGLLPAVQNGVVTGGGTWRTILLTPGRHPVEELAVQLGNAVGLSAGSVRADLARQPATVNLVVRQILAARSAECVLIMVDQFEEVFALCPDERERAAFIGCLVEAAAGQDASVRMVLGVRADFFARCAQYPALVAALRDRQVLIGPMEAAGLRAVIREPAARAGVKVEAALIEAIIADAEGEPGALPLVSHALYETWKRRTGDTMTLAAYHRAGGVRGAIAQSAERSQIRMVRSPLLLASRRPSGLNATPSVRSSWPRSTGPGVPLTFQNRAGRPRSPPRPGPRTRVRPAAARARDRGAAARGRRPRAGG
jgi:energy-coupling factor transporter ATP-binding protein EcfA2